MQNVCPHKKKAENGTNNAEIEQIMQKFGGKCRNWVGNAETEHKTQKLCKRQKLCQKCRNCVMNAEVEPKKKMQKLRGKMQKLSRKCRN